MKRLFILCLSLCIASSCQKDKSHEINNQTNISISSPTEEQIYTRGDTVFIKAAITSVSGIHGYTTSIYSDTGEELYKIEEHAHGKNVAVDKYWVYKTDLQNVGDLQLVINAIINHEGETLECRKKVYTK